MCAGGLNECEKAGTPKTSEGGSQSFRLSWNLDPPTLNSVRDGESSNQTSFLSHLSEALT